MIVTNSKNEVYKFTNGEVVEIFIWAFGFADIAHKGLLPIDLDNNMENTNLYKKLKQCLRNNIEVIQKTRRL